MFAEGLDWRDLFARESLVLMISVSRFQGLPTIRSRNLHAWQTGAAGYIIGATRRKLEIDYQPRKSEAIKACCLQRDEWNGDRRSHASTDMNGTVFQVE